MTPEQQYDDAEKLLNEIEHIRDLILFPCIVEEMKILLLPKERQPEKRRNLAKHVIEKLDEILRGMPCIDFKKFSNCVRDIETTICDEHLLLEERNSTVWEILSDLFASTVKELTEQRNIASAALRGEHSTYHPSNGVA